jgi:peptidyl-prolyl cis-trans isomerase C
MQPAIALIVNGEGVWLEEYQASFQQFHQAQASAETQVSEDEARQKVIDDLVNLVLLEQGANAAGYHPGPTEVQTRIDTLQSQMGGVEIFQSWLQRNFYSMDVFRQSLLRSMAVEWQKRQLMLNVPASAEQVHARQVLVNSSEIANQVLADLQGGQDFKTIAFQYDPLTGGDLGWFPRGYLTQKAVEDAAFELQPGEYRGVIQTELGYHIVEVIERDPAYPLSADAKMVLQKAAVAHWIVQQKAISTIEILVP